jgi:hypothetical protein
MSDKTLDSIPQQLLGAKHEFDLCFTPWYNIPSLLLGLISLAGYAKETSWVLKSVPGFHRLTASMLQEICTALSYDEHCFSLADVQDIYHVDAPMETYAVTYHNASIARPFHSAWDGTRPSPICQPRQSGIGSGNSHPRKRRKVSSPTRYQACNTGTVYQLPTPGPSSIESSANCAQLDAFSDLDSLSGQTNLHAGVIGAETVSLRQLSSSVSDTSPDGSGREGNGTRYEVQDVNGNTFCLCQRA